MQLSLSLVSSLLVACLFGRSVAYTFDKYATNNVAVYFGQTDITGTTSLEAQCEDPDVDIVIVAFLDQYFGPNGFPGVNFGAACGGQTAEQASIAPGLLYCPVLAANITACQNMGKKVLLSIGGATSTSSFTNDTQAQQFASTVWNLFGGGTEYDDQLRPFGSVVLDGFDVDNEDNIQTGLTAFGTALRGLLPQDTSKTYYISAAPQCPYPDASDPMGLMAVADFVWVQFYNNYCDIGTSYFISSVQQWSSELAAQNSDTRLFLGVIGWAAGGSGYASPASLTSAIQSIKALSLPNFGGAMTWDGPEAHANVNSGQTYVEVMKNALN